MNLCNVALLRVMKVSSSTDANIGRSRLFCREPTIAIKWWCCIIACISCLMENIFWAFVHIGYHL